MLALCGEADLGWHLEGEASQSRIDLDNAIKAALDALQGVAYRDDKQVTRIVATVGEAIEHGGLSITTTAAAGRDEHAQANTTTSPFRR